MRPRWILLLIVCLAAIVAVLFTARRQSEPILHGKPLTYWLEPGRQHPKEPPEAIAAVFAEMDERCVHFLIRELDWRPSRLVAMLNAPLRRISIVPFQDRPDHRALAANTLGMLGPRAVSAIPALEKLARGGVGPRSSDARGAAIAALILLRSDPLELLLEKLRDPSNPNWNVYASAIWYLGTNAAPAAPLLVHVVENSTSSWARVRAASALSAIRSRPDVAVPAAASLLTQTTLLVRWEAVIALGSFGPEARPAWDALVRCLNDPETIIRSQTTTALRQIDPEAARQLGIN